MAWPEALWQRQDLDLELKQSRQRLADITAQLHPPAEVLQAQQEAEAAAAAAEQARKEQKEREFQLAQLETKLQQHERKLYSGQVKNARELADQQAKVQSLQRRKSQAEDALLEAMLAREAAEEHAEETAAHASALQAEWETLRQAMVVEQERLQERLQHLTQEITALDAQIPAAVLESYHYLKPRTGGIPVARLKGDVCGVCGMVVPPSTRHKVRRGEEAYCDSCRRLLIA